VADPHDRARQAATVAPWGAWHEAARRLSQGVRQRGLAWAMRCRPGRWPRPSAGGPPHRSRRPPPSAARRPPGGIASRDTSRAKGLELMFDVGLDRVGQHVHPCQGGQPRRAGAGQLRVHQGGPGMMRSLTIVLFSAAGDWKHGVVGHLRTCPPWWAGRPPAGCPAPARAGCGPCGGCAARRCPGCRPARDPLRSPGRCPAGGTTTSQRSRRATSPPRRPRSSPGPARSGCT